MDVWCNWCGTVTEVSPQVGGQSLGCLACRRMFIVPPSYGTARLTEEEVLGILGVEGYAVTEDEVLAMLDESPGRPAGSARQGVRRAPAGPIKARPSGPRGETLLADAE